MTDSNFEIQLFNEWNERKKKIHINAKSPKVREGDIYWCAFGKNVGVEINGKGMVFTRPVLVFKKLSQYGFLGIPLTSQVHTGPWYVSFRFQNKDQIAVLAQIRVFSVSRLYHRMGQIDENDFREIRECFHDFFCK